MDEGAVIAYASRVLDGEVPHRDFLTFYGPGNPWLVAGASRFGESVGVERAVGVVYRVLIVARALPHRPEARGPRRRCRGGLVAAMLMAEDDVWAYATYGALAFGLVGLALLCGRPRAPVGDGIAVAAAGVAAGCAVLVRFDFTLAVVLGGVADPGSRRAWTRSWFAAGFLAACAVLRRCISSSSGPERIGRVVERSLAAGPGRYLQRQTIWEFPGNLLAVAALSTALLVVGGSVLTWRLRSDTRAGVALAAGIFAAGLFRYALSRRIRCTSCPSRSSR